MQDQIIFTETQKFGWGLLILIIVLSALPIVGILVYQLITGQLIGNRPATNEELLLLTLLIPLPLILLFAFLRLTTLISTSEISYGWNLPTTKLNTLKWSEVETAALIQCKFVGFGYRVSREYGIVYNVKGNIGLQIIKKNGRKILIGTSKPEQLKAAIATI